MRRGSRWAKVDPLPLVPPTVIASGGGASRMRAAPSRTRSSPSAIVAGCCAEMYSSHSSSESFFNLCFAGSSLGRRLALEQREQARDLVAQLPAVDDHVDRAFLEEELRPLDSLGPSRGSRLLDDPRPGEA